jgi:hypothetical protein
MIVSDEKKTVTVKELLEEQVGHELERRDGEWSAFTASVFRQIDSEDRGVARASLEDQAIELFKAEIGSELNSIAPRFDEAFKDSVEQRIFASAKEPSLWERLKSAASDLMRPQIAWRFAGAAAAAGVFALAIVQNPGTEMVAEVRPGEVSVESIGFEGTVTVVPQQGVTVIWLSDDA